MCLHIQAHRDAERGDLETAKKKGCIALILDIIAVVSWIIFFLPRPAGGEAASRVGPKIVLDHVRVYIYIYMYKLCLCALDFLTIGCIRCYNVLTTHLC